MSNMGKWDPWYLGLDAKNPQPYGDLTTYEVAAEWLKGLQVEDWGCGKGWFRTYFEPDKYTGIDGSYTPFADKIVDLTTYESRVEGILLRHVLEHNDQWDAILVGALRSATKRLAIVLFTPMAEFATVIARAPDIDVPDISLSHADLCNFFEGWHVYFEDFKTNTQYGAERVYLLKRDS